MGTSEYNEACANTSYPKDDALFGRGVFNCDQLDNGALVLFALGVLYMFFALAIVCDEYFVPALEVRLLDTQRRRQEKQTSTWLRVCATRLAEGTNKTENGRNSCARTKKWGCATGKLEVVEL